MSIDLQRASGIFPEVRRQGAQIPADLSAVCLWAFLGLGVTALMIALGFGLEIAEALGRTG